MTNKGKSVGPKDLKDVVVVVVVVVVFLFYERDIKTSEAHIFKMSLTLNSPSTVVCFFSCTLLLLLLLSLLLLLFW